nr:zinc finger, CCHC-type [Tanacetum cinerariifolium]
MGDENPIRTLGDYSRPSHEGYRNTIELPDGKKVVPLRSDTIRLVQKGCLFHRLCNIKMNLSLKHGLVSSTYSKKSLIMDFIKVLVREEARHPITKNVNAISFVKMEKEKNIENNEVVDKNVIELSELNAIEPKDVVDMKK